MATPLASPVVSLAAPSFSLEAGVLCVLMAALSPPQDARRVTPAIQAWLNNQSYRALAVWADQDPEAADPPERHLITLAPETKDALWKGIEANSLVMGVVGRAALPAVGLLGPSPRAGEP